MGQNQKTSRSNSGQIQVWLNILLIIVTFALLAGVILIYYARYPELSEHNLREFIRSYGPWSPVVYSILYLASAPLPFFAAIISAVGGALFGTVRGAVLTIFISTVSALVPFWLARRLGRDWVQSKLRTGRLKPIYSLTGGKSGFMFVLILRLLPVVPWEVQSYVSGLTRVSTTSFFLATLLGGIPSSFAFAFMGHSFTRGEKNEIILGIVLVLLVGGILPFIASRVRMGKNKKDEPQDPSEENLP